MEPTIDELERSAQEARNRPIKPKVKKADKYQAGTTAGVGMMIISTAYGIGLIAGHALSGQLPDDGYDTLRWVVGAIILGHILVNSNGKYLSAGRLVRRNLALAVFSFLSITALTALITALISQG